jgi:hypothetical protein
MLKFTKAKFAVCVGLLMLSLSPLVLVGSGPALIFPIMHFFWLAGLAEELGLPVGEGPDAFNLFPPNALGAILIALGSAISLAGYYVVAAFLVAMFSKKK